MTALSMMTLADLSPGDMFRFIDEPVLRIVTNFNRGWPAGNNCSAREDSWCIYSVKGCHFSCHIGRKKAQSLEVMPMLAIDAPLFAGVQS